MLHCISRATARLVGAALDGAGDPEAGAVASSFAPAWLKKSEKLKVEMGFLKDKLNKLKE